MLADPGYFSRAWWDYTYLARGRYAEQLERWLEVFPPEQLLVLASDELAERAGPTYGRVLEFLGAAPHELDSYPRIFSRDYPAMKPETRRMLADYYAEPNRRLLDLLTSSAVSTSPDMDAGAGRAFGPVPPFCY
jgi:hypothetical protein